jgi:hypothetical protein
MIFQPEGAIELLSGLTERQPGTASNSVTPTTKTSDEIQPVNRLPLDDEVKIHWQSTKWAKSCCAFCQLEQSKTCSAEKERMLAQGWCVHQIDYFSRMFDKATFSYIATRVRPPRGTDHTLCAEMSSCVAYNVDMNNYETRHVDDTCTCEMMAVPYDQLIKIIEEGDVPLVSIEVNGNGELNLRLCKRKMSSHYTAISHVWADGLGNPHDNAIPLCQARMLEKRVGSVHKRWKPRFNFSLWTNTITFLDFEGKTVN